MTSIRQDLALISPDLRSYAKLLLQTLALRLTASQPAATVDDSPERRRLISSIVRQVPDDDISEELVGRLADGVINGYYSESKLNAAIKDVGESVRLYHETKGARGKENYWYPLQGWLMKRYQQNNIEWTACKSKPVQRAPRPANIRKITSHGREFYYDFDNDCEIE